ncbi:MAG TPA: ectonucleotide pyrophosphatase/phosphodiesterase [Lachnospiraceae bacterium]|nr:ectonucleotide pyrophosphatase/phosphodiesterase [Lachnospiraceae bacterium]
MFEKNNSVEQPDRLIMISLDAMGAKDLELMSTLPHMAAFMKKAAICNNVNSVYPSLTYPAHTSIITGKSPKNHGIINNTLFQPQYENPDWASNRKFIKGTTLYDEVIKKGWKVASLLWPVTGKSKIQYNLSEIHANRWWQDQTVLTALNGSFKYNLQLLKFMGELKKGIRQPALDNFVQKAALYTIRKYNPNMLLVHFLDVDLNRHAYGVNHDKVKEAIMRMDLRIGEILAALESTGDMNKTTVVILGDHYQKDTHTVVYFNNLLKKKGYLETKGCKIKSYKVIAKNCDGSCYIYLNPKYKNNAKMTEEVTHMFQELQKDSTYGIQHIFSSKEVESLGADDTCVLMIEAKDGYYYLDETEALTRRVNEVKKHKMRGTHGYLPTKNDYQTFFMASGCGIHEGVRINEMTLMDEGVTLAKLLDVNLGKVDGKVIEQLLK